MNRYLNCFIVYGGFKDPSNGKNFIVIHHYCDSRYKIGVKLQLAITKLISVWFTPEDKEHDKTAIMWGRELKCDWSTDGSDKEYIATTKLARHFIWKNGILNELSEPTKFIPPTWEDTYL